MPDHPSPLTPAPFASQQMQTPDPAPAPPVPQPATDQVSGFITFGASSEKQPSPPASQEEAAEPVAPEAEAPPLATPPPQPASPVSPLPSAAVAEGASLVDQPAASEQAAPPAEATGFVTFGPARTDAPAEPETAPATGELEPVPVTPPPEAPAIIAAAHGELTAPPREAIPARPVADDPAPAAASPPAAAETPPRAAGVRAESQTSARRGPPRLLLLAVVGALVAAVVGFLITSSGSKKAHSSAPAPLTGLAQASSLSLKTPSGWRQQQSIPAIDGVTLEHALAVQASTGAELVVAPVTSDGATLLPASLLATLPTPPTGEPISLPPYTLLRYPELGSTKAYVYAIPTTAGTLLGVCLPPPAGGQTATAAQCERMLATVRYGSAAAATIGPSSSYGQAVSTALSQLNTTGAAAHAELQSARTPAGQAAGAERLAAAYEQAARALAGAHPEPAAEAVNGKLATALKRAAAAYGAMAAAARRNDGGAYRNARSQVRGSISAVEAAFGELQKLGYKLA